MGRRNRTTPQSAGAGNVAEVFVERQNMRLSRAAHRKTSMSAVPGATAAIQTTSCPANESIDRRARKILVCEKTYGHVTGKTFSECNKSRA